MMDCQAKLEGGILVLGSSRIRRQYAWNEGHLAAYRKYNDQPRACLRLWGLAGADVR